MVGINMSIEFCSGNTKRVKCRGVIPKGSLYFMGESNDIVSDTFMVTEILESIDGEYANQPRRHSVKSNAHNNKKKRKRRAKRR